MQPIDFTHEVMARCQQRQGHLALPESLEPRILRTAHELLKQRCVASISFFTPEQQTMALADSLGVKLTTYANRLQWVDVKDMTNVINSGHLAAPIDTVAAITRAAQLLQSGAVTAVVAGAVATTAQVIRAGIREIGLASGVKTVSGSFIMHRVANQNQPTSAASALLLYADAGVVIAPTLTQLVDIAAESAKTWRRLVTPITGAAPVVAFLSFSTKGSAAHESATRMASAHQLFQQQHPHIESDGELQFDAAIDPEICRRKAPQSAVAGRANCFIFPDLSAGNIAYKITQRLAHYHAYGPLLQGLNRPFSDLSRGSTVSDIFMSACLNLLQAEPV